MSLPLTTTTVTIKRFSSVTPGTLDLKYAARPAVVGKISGKELWAYKGMTESGWREDLTAKLNIDTTPVAYGDIVTDDGTGTLYRVVWVEDRQGLGMDHTEAGLAVYAPTGLYSCFRGTAVDAYGDTVPSNSNYAPSAAAWSAMAGEVHETQRTTQGPATDQPGSQRVLSGRFPRGLDIRPRDAIRNDSTGQVYVVSAVGYVTESAGSDTGVEFERYTA